MPESKKTIFYGWKIVNTLFWLNAILMGTVFVFGVFFKSLEAQFNISRSVTSSIVSAYMVAMAGVAVLGGWALDRFGPKKLVLIMGLLTGVGLLLTSQVHAVWQFYITYSLLLALGSGATYVVSMPLIIRWFEKKRGLATGITMAGVEHRPGNSGAASHFLHREFQLACWIHCVGFIALVSDRAAFIRVKKRPG